MQTCPTDSLLRALAGDQIDQLFLRAAGDAGVVPRLPAELVEQLRARRLRVAASLARQDHLLDEACALLDDLKAKYVVFKGVLARALLYAEPHLRPAVDVDLLLASEMTTSVAGALAQRGYHAGVAPHSDTHELTLTRPGIEIDLHWSLLRPGRMRVDITPEILANRVRRGELWSPNDTHLTVAMLVHPAITDHVTGRLISAVDLDRWLRQTAVEWNAVIEVLGRIGLRTAAWAMLRWTHGLFDTPVPEEAWRALSPPRLRQRYIDAWLHRDPGRLYAQRPNLVRGAFSLALQDRVSDAARALWKLARKDRISLAQT
jgi:hypothetical protein